MELRLAHLAISCHATAARLSKHLNMRQQLIPSLLPSQMPSRMLSHIWLHQSSSSVQQPTHWLKRFKYSSNAKDNKNANFLNTSPKLRSPSESIDYYDTSCRPTWNCTPIVRQKPLDSKLKTTTQSLRIKKLKILAVYKWPSMFCQSECEWKHTPWACMRISIHNSSVI